MRALPFLCAVALLASACATSHTVALGGDVAFARVTRAGLRPISGGTLATRAPALVAADFAVVNLETPLARADDCRAPRALGPRSPLFRGEPDAADLLAAAGVDAVALANNHALDCGPGGLAATLESLSCAGVAAAGAVAPGAATDGGDPFAPVVVQRRGVRFALLSATDRSHRAGPDPRSHLAFAYGERRRTRLVAGVEAVRASLPAAVVVVSLHWGAEHVSRPSRDQRALAHALIDAGADIVAGHHAHRVQPMERYGGGVIFYGLGDLRMDVTEGEGALGLVTLQRTGSDTRPRVSDAILRLLGAP